MKIFILLLISLNCFATQLFSPLPTKIEIANRYIVQLGEELFFDPILSKNKNISCFNCHFQYGADTNQFSIGTNGEKGFIHAPSVFNLKYQVAYFWNGRASSLEEQAAVPFILKHEMQMDKTEIEERLKQSSTYQQLFQKAFAQKPSFKLVLEAISEFQKTLITPNSKFDRFLRKETNLTKEEQEGFKLFKNYGCVSCHNGINLGGNSFQKFGAVVKEDLFETKKNDRYSFTKKQSDIGVYKVPILRNIAKTAPYFHTGEVKDLQTAIKIMALYNLGRELKDQEIQYIKSFLNTLTGELPTAFQKRIQEVN